MRITHLACLQSSLKNSGVVSQMSQEAITARENGFFWNVELWSSDILETDVCKTLGHYSRFFIFRRLIFLRKIKQSLQVSDIVLLRYMPLDFLTLFLWNSEKKKIVIVYHTLRGEYLKNFGLVGKFIKLIDDFIQENLKRKLLGVVGVTRQILESEVNSSNCKNLIFSVYPNAFNVNDSSEKLVDQREGKIKVAFIASQFYYWNGLEDIIKSIQDEHFKNAELILVGRLTSQRQHDLVKEYSNLITHFEYLTSAQLSKLYSKLDLSLGAFSLEKVGLAEACTLKVRDSIAHGVAVYSGHKDTALSGTEFYFEGPANLQRIIEVAENMRAYSKFDVFVKSKSFLDKKIYMQRLLNQFCSHDK